MTDPRASEPLRIAGWLPAQEDLEAWLEGRHDRTGADRAGGLRHASVARFRDLVDGDPVLRMQVHEMIEQVPNRKPYRKRHLRSVDHLYELVDDLLDAAPEFSDDGTVMTPLGAVLDWTTGTRAGFAVYRDARVNAALREILDEWAQFLDGPDSRYVLDDSEHGWLSERARATVGMDQFEYDPEAEFGGFASWNDFFTRRFRDGERPVAHPDDDRVVVNACESTPYGISTDVKLRDRFWIKGQPYSLHDMLAGDPVAEQLVGGTVYQAFLSATDYHRWHSPVAGTVVRAFVQQGTYFSEADSEGPDAVEPTNSQGYLAHVATRAVIVLEADEPAIGTLAFVAVGMVDVSSCRIDDAVTPGAHVDKGQEIGMFRYGGSTYCLVFGPGVVTDFALAALPQPGRPDAPPLHVHARLATVDGAT